MIIQTRVCDLCNKEMTEKTEYIPQIQILGKPRGGWKMTGYAEFNDICKDCHDKILEKILSLRVKGSAFRVNVKEKNDEDNEDSIGCTSRINKSSQYKKHKIKVSNKN